MGLRHLALRLSYTTQTRGQALDLRSGEAELENQSTPGVHVCVFITAVPIIKLFARGEGCVFIAAVPITKVFACGGGETMEDM